jgi:periplasmic protein CpxP/Spy
MKRTIVTLATLLAAAGIANAQTTTPSTPSTTPSAPSTTTPPSSSGSTTTMPGASGSAGATSSMSMSSVKSKIEANGYSNVTNLKQDATGDWTAKATKGGKQVALSVDSKGTVKEAQQ